MRRRADRAGQPRPVSGACAACGAAALRPHLEVEPRPRARAWWPPPRLRRRARPTSCAAAPAATCRWPSSRPRPSWRRPTPRSTRAPTSTRRRASGPPRRGRWSGSSATCRPGAHLRPRLLGRASCCPRPSARGWQAQGVEPSRFAAEYARERLGLDVHDRHDRRAELPAGAFDARGHGRRDRAPARPGRRRCDRVGALLRPGGVLYLALPDAGSRVARALGARWWSVLPTHVQYFTRRSLARLLSRHGFAVEWIEHRARRPSPCATTSSAWRATRRRWPGPR